MLLFCSFFQGDLDKCTPDQLIWTILLIHHPVCLLTPKHTHTMYFQLFRNWTFSLKYWRKSKWLPVAPQVARFKVRGEGALKMSSFYEKERATFYLFLPFQKYFCTENRGFLNTMWAVLYFHGLTQAKGQALRSHFHIRFKFTGQRQYPKLHPGMKSKQV